MIEGPTDETSLKGLADAIKLLYDTEAREWTADDVISLVDELSGVFLPLSLIHRIICSCPPNLAIMVFQTHGCLGKLTAIFLTVAEV